MCRMALMNREGAKYIEQMTGLTDFFDTLEDSFGGHGNGYSIIYRNSRRKIVKGVKLDNSIISRDILENIENIKWIIYHTRLASAGGIADENCHPFTMNNRVLCMNGTENAVKPFIRGNRTDTETILELACKQGLNLFKTVSEFHSAFFGLENNKVFATKGTGDLHLMTKENGIGKGAVVFASEFPSYYYRVGMVYEAPKAWIEGQRIPAILTIAKEPIHYTYTYGIYGSYNSNYKAKKSTTPKTYAESYVSTAIEVSVGTAGTTEIVQTGTDIVPFNFTDGEPKKYFLEKTDRKISTEQYWQEIEDAQQKRMEIEAELEREDMLKKDWEARNEAYCKLFAEDNPEVEEKLRSVM